MKVCVWKLKHSMRGIPAFFTMIARKRNTGYTECALEKDSARCGNLTTKGGQPPAVRFFYVRFMSPMVGHAGQPQGWPVPFRTGFPPLHGSAALSWKEGLRVQNPYERRQIMSESTTSSNPAFKPFSWLTNATSYNSQHEFICQTHDIASGIKTVLQLLEMDEFEKEDQRPGMFSDYHVGALRRFVIASADLLQLEADAAITRINKNPKNH